MAANPISEGPARQTPQGVLICEFANYLKIILPAQQGHRYGSRLMPRGPRRFTTPAPQPIQQPHLTSPATIERLVESIRQYHQIVANEDNVGNAVQYNMAEFVQ